MLSFRGSAITRENHDDTAAFLDQRRGDVPDQIRRAFQVYISSVFTFQSIDFNKESAVMIEFKRQILLPCLFALCASLPIKIHGQTITQEQLEMAKSATALVLITNASGEVETTASAFAVSKSGFFVTSLHTVKTNQSFKIKLAIDIGSGSGSAHEAEVVSTSEEYDLALLKIDKTVGSEFILGDIEGLTETSEIVCLGFPYGTSLSLSQKEYPSITISTGKITSLRKKEGKLRLIQTDASVTPGNSGGPILDSKGELIGIVSSGIEGGGINFAVPVTLLKEFLNRPETQLKFPDIHYENRYESATFSVSLKRTNTIEKKAYRVFLGRRNILGEFEEVELLAVGDGRFTASATPLPKPNNTYSDHLVIDWIEAGLMKSGVIKDSTIQIDKFTTSLSNLSFLKKLGNSHSVVGKNGKEIKGSVSGLEAVEVTQADGKNKVNLQDSEGVVIRKIGADSAEFEVRLRITDLDENEVASSLHYGGFGDSPVSAIADAKRSQALRGSTVGIGKQLETEVEEVEISGDASDVFLGGDGKYLIIFCGPKRMLHVFNVHTLELEGSMNVTKEDVQIAAGLNEVVLGHPAAGLIQTFSLPNLEKIKTAKIPVGEVVRKVSMGSANSKFFLLISTDGSEAMDRGHLTFIDVNTLKPLEIPYLKNENGRFPYLFYRDQIELRASSDGMVYAFSQKSVSPSGLNSIVIKPDGWRFYNNHDSEGLVIPGPGNRIFSSKGYYNPSLTRVTKIGQTYENRTLVPSISPEFYLSINRGLKVFRRRDLEKLDPLEVGIHVLGAPAPLTTIKDVPGASLGFVALGPEEYNRDVDLPSLNPDKRIILFPDQNLFVTVPLTGGKIYLKKVSARQMLKDSDISVFVITSSPPEIGRAGTTLNYQITVKSKAGNVKYKLEQGPQGMTVSPFGKVVWKIRSDAPPFKKTALISISDSSGQEIFHEFEVQVLQR